MSEIRRLARQVRTNVWVHCALLASFVGFGVLLESLSPAVVRVCLGVGVIGILYHTPLTAFEQNDIERPWPLSLLPDWSLFFVPAGALVGGYSYSNQVTAIRIVVFGALLVMFFYFWFVLPAAWFHKLRSDDRHEVPDPPGSSLSILVPAYNEEACLGRTIDSIVAARYPGEKEVIVVDDGSTDRTYEVALEHATDEVEVVRKPNGGKHSALNYGIDRADGDAIVTVDADSVVAEDALVRIVTDLEADPEVGAIGGTVTRSTNRSTSRGSTSRFGPGSPRARRAPSAFGCSPPTSGTN